MSVHIFTPAAFLLNKEHMRYATPMAYKTNLLVMNAGSYTFKDFIRVSVPLTIIVWLGLSVFLPSMYVLG